jgi:putative flippase GtrA
MNWNNGHIIRNHKSTFIKFLLVGGAATILNYSVFLALYEFFDVHYLISSGTGYISGVVFGFYFNKIFTFESGSDNYYEEGAAYFAIYTASLLMSLA